MALTRAEALTRLRQRLRDTVSANYAYTDTLLYTYMGDALREVGVALRKIDPDYFLTSVVVVAYTDALDTGGRYEFYPLPANCAAVRWIERHDGSLHYALWQSTAAAQEQHRYVGLFTGTATVGSETVNIPPVGAFGPESATVHKDRFRVIPPPSSADGKQWRVWYEPALVVPDGTSELLPVPELFEKAVVDIARFLALDDEGDPMAARARVQAYGGVEENVRVVGSLATAIEAQRGRTRKDWRVGSVV